MQKKTLSRSQATISTLLESLPSRRQALVAAATARVLSHFYVDEIYLPSTPRQAVAIVLVDAAVEKVVV